MKITILSRLISALFLVMLSGCKKSEPSNYVFNPV